jgi:hypothetical protein
MYLVPYIVRKNETLVLIAKRFGVTLKELLQYNQAINNPDLIFVGQQIKVPVDVGTITSDDITIPTDNPIPRIPYVRTKDDAIIELPDHIKLPYRGNTRITQEYAQHAGVSGSKGQGYRVSISISEAEGPGKAAAKELGGAVAGGIANKAAETGGIMPKLPFGVGLFLDMITPKSLAGEYQFMSTADNGTAVAVMITYTTNQGILDTIF